MAEVHKVFSLKHSLFWLQTLLFYKYLLLLCIKLHNFNYVSEPVEQAMHINTLPNFARYRSKNCSFKRSWITCCTPRFSYLSQKLHCLQRWAKLHSMARANLKKSKDFCYHSIKVHTQEAQNLYKLIFPLSDIT